MKAVKLHKNYSKNETWFSIVPKSIYCQVINYNMYPKNSALILTAFNRGRKSS